MAKYTVHNIPILLRPFLFIFGWVLATLFYLLNFSFRKLCKIEYIGKEHVENNPSHIFSFWHENLPLFFIAHAYFRKPNILLTFPLWYMKPVHVLKGMKGIKELAYGASGLDGKKALEQILARLRQGWSTFLNPDGPKGPIHEVKNGVLLMSLKTGRPIIPIGFQVKGNWRLPSWDRKRYPPYFSTFKVIYGEPIWVNQENFEAVKTTISRGMMDQQPTQKGSLQPPLI